MEYMEYVKITDIADIERVKKNKIYPAGTTLLQVSATKGQTIYLNKDSTAESKYVAITPNVECDTYYIFSMIEAVIENFCHKYQADLNIQIADLKFMEIPFWDLKTQREFGTAMKAIDSTLEMVSKDIKEHKEMKDYFLDGMFPKG